MPYPDPSVGPPVDYQRTPGSFSLAHYLTQRLTQPGNSVTSPTDWLHALLRPRAALAAGLTSPYGQIGTILVPGAGKGIATAEQGNLLRSIEQTSYSGEQGALGGGLYRGRPFQSGFKRGSERKVTIGGVTREGPPPTYNVFNPNDPSVQRLAELIGHPAPGREQRVYPGQLTAGNPYSHILGTNVPVQTSQRAEHPGSDVHQSVLIGRGQTAAELRRTAVEMLHDLGEHPDITWPGAKDLFGAIAAQVTHGNYAGAERMLTEHLNSGQWHGPPGGPSPVAEAMGATIVMLRRAQQAMPFEGGEYNLFGSSRGGAKHITPDLYHMLKNIFGPHWEGKAGPGG